MVTDAAGVSVRPGLGLRVVLALAVSALSAVVVVIISRHALPTSDFDQCWVAARALLAGRNPYDVIGPGREFPWRWPFFYPLPAALVAVPFLPLGMGGTRVLFTALSAGLLAFALGREHAHRLLVLVSAGFAVFLLSAQWSPLLTAAALLPGLGFVYAAKPTLGLALFAARPSRVAAGGALLLVLASLAVMPGWPADWWRVAHEAHHLRTPLLTPAGPLLLLALLKWRRPEARLLVVLACVPQTLVLYETVPLFLVPATAAESLVLAALSWATQVLTFTMRAKPPDPAFYSRSALAITALMYLPCLVMILRRKNERPA